MSNHSSVIDFQADVIQISIFGRVCLQSIVNISFYLFWRYYP